MMETLEQTVRVIYGGSIFLLPDTGEETIGQLVLNVKKLSGDVCESNLIARDHNGRLLDQGERYSESFGLVILKAS
ncbi:hypothetical protein C1N53_16420 [Pontibacter sp. SGAir0037]|nr:hypothetical protein C1N53_16420 [Pontibacter sp. SGAir0037]